MVQEDAALPVETSAFHDHGQKPETSEIETAGSYQKSELAAGHHRAPPLASTVVGSRDHASPSDTDRVRIRERQS
jgi:hypothetical protein